jgi:hypothetical protein
MQQVYNDNPHRQGFQRTSLENLDFDVDFHHRFDIANANDYNRSSMLDQ